MSLVLAEMASLVSFNLAESVISAPSPQDESMNAGNRTNKENFFFIRYISFLCLQFTP